MSNTRRAFIKAKKEELREKQRLVDATNSYTKACDAKRDKGLVYYSESFRREIYTRAKLRGFSAQDLEKMAYYLDPDHWNQDEVRRTDGEQIFDAIDLFYKAEQYLNANAPKKPISKKIFDGISSFGGHMDKEDESNDN